MTDLKDNTDIANSCRSRVQWTMRDMLVLLTLIGLCIASTLYWQGAAPGIMAICLYLLLRRLETLGWSLAPSHALALMRLWAAVVGVTWLVPIGIISNAYITYLLSLEGDFWYVAASSAVAGAILGYRFPNLFARLVPPFM
jgi:hypothetical protein